MQPIYLDVRTAAEFAEGHHPHAVNHDVQLLMAGIFPDESLVPKDAQIAIYCRSGGRAGVAEQILHQAGYVHAKNVGGLSDLA